MSPTPAQICPKSRRRCACHHSKIQLTELTQCGPPAPSVSRPLINPTPAPICPKSRVDCIRKCGIVAVEDERRWDVRDVESQPRFHDAEAGFGEELMMFRFVAPKVFRQIFIKQEVRE